VAASSLGYVLSTGFLSLVVTRVLGGIGEGIGGNVFGPTGGPIWQALVTEVAPEEMRGSVLGLMGAVTGFASTPAPMVGGWMYEAMDPQAPFYLSFGLAAVGVMVFIAAVREPLRAVPD
jgi:MFS family permease